ncbi:hypothetical protein E0F15_05360 [Frankia sp. B2]|uniref:Aminoglycoside phosphotransferase domain-containing protein n=1 Tax=Frankia casuarinae (strain DSM 45818 / CECT 9043 / HFP020203 / CcI3) TaxID=106370 RepID=Q2J8J0_FRACC|nr:MULTISPECIES: hypothetical protein [Frankia]ABD12402.1 hypothetical protein Francci3_3045 [Frankia casuarinae]KDA44776.1 hypothetical protein BMG523Draft_00298 [Frankia sp. BMG5.23]ORT54329.1 hypothetical protein KBI5_04715 [Frankia sp. KB5]ORT97229.1 hypothetical protein UK99_06375 [Frankia casuarinae]TFE33432.1 hypothetical protein E0F15_05360 [Frankia sp. B2]
MRWVPVRVDDAWMGSVWRDGAAQLGVQPQGAPALSASGNVIGGPVTHRGETAWLRVAPFLEDAMDVEPWHGTRDAGPLTGICKPTLLDSAEWTHPDPVPVPVCAELMTYVPDPPATPGDQYLGRPLDLSSAWLADLRASLDALSRQPTGREIWGNRIDRYTNLLHAVFGRPAPADAVPGWGSTEHLDLHWGNVTVPNLMILDWEHWGTNVAGYGAARLYCTALAVPDVASRIYTTFADVLSSPSGRYAILVNAADILSDFTHYRDEVGLCPALHRVAAEILS